MLLTKMCQYQGVSSMGKQLSALESDYRESLLRVRHEIHDSLSRLARVDTYLKPGDFDIGYEQGMLESALILISTAIKRTV